MPLFKTLGLIFLLLGNFLFPKDALVKSQDGRVNILIMGMGGVGHEGGDLTDTIILVSIALDKPKVVAISIPRDVWIPEIRAKVNSAYHYGGMALAKSSVEKITGLQIQYSVVIDFSAFEKIVDDLGGIQIKVENSFTDLAYPIAGRENDLCDGDREFKCRYETVTFLSGSQLMDGGTALKFVRSRYAQGPEGTDLAREARQQKTIDAIKNKIMTPQIFLNLSIDLKLWKDLNESLVRDIDDPATAVLVRKIFDSRDSINKYLIPGNLLIAPPTLSTYDKQYVFIPKAGNGKWEDIHKWILGILK